MNVGMAIVFASSGTIPPIEVNRYPQEERSIERTSRANTMDEWFKAFSSFVLRLSSLIIPPSSLVSRPSLFIPAPSHYHVHQLTLHHDHFFRSFAGSEFPDLGIRERRCFD